MIQKTKLKINDQTYKLGLDNFIKKRYRKQQIVLSNTFSQNMNHVTGWKNRCGGKYKGTTPFSIDIYGNVYQHYDPEYHSEFFGVKGLDEYIIPISIENEGWLTKDIINDEYINYVGNIYNRKDDIVEKRWRGQTYWAPYTEVQIESALKLSMYLCDLFNIPLQSVDHNTKFEGVYGFEGVVYKSNFNKHEGLASQST